MKLKYRKGRIHEVGELLAISYDNHDARVTLLVEVNGVRELYTYKSFAEMHGEWEDYNEAEKPALTEKEHDYLVSWLNLINYASYDGIKRNKNRLDLMHGQQDVSSIPTFGRFRWWPDGKDYTMAELGL